MIDSARRSSLLWCTTTAHTLYTRQHSLPCVRFLENRWMRLPRRWLAVLAALVVLVLGARRPSHPVEVLPFMPNGPLAATYHVDAAYVNLATSVERASLMDARWRGKLESEVVVPLLSDLTRSEAVDTATVTRCEIASR